MARLSPVYATPEPNTAIPLYDGPIGLGNDVGSIRFEWLPSPKARFEIPDHESYSGSVDVALSLPGSNGPTPVLITSTTAGSNIPTSISGVLNGPMEFGTGTDLSYLIFHLTNFDSTFTGRDETPPERLTDDWKPDDIFLNGNGWKVKIEPVSNLDQLEKHLKTTGGYAITHVGRLERDDGSPFTADEAERMLGILHYFLSFVRGYWVALILPIGYDERGQKRWEQWGSWRLDSWRSRVSWFDSQHGQWLQPAFRGFLDRWRDTALWHDPIRRALHWYIEANRGGGDVETFIMLTQATLDLLSETVFVEVEKTATEREFRNQQDYPASRKIRDLLNWAGIPTELPTLCAGLSAVAPTLGFTDGPDAFASTRNWIGHPTKKNREKFRQLDSEGINDTWRLGLRYLELALLRLFDYQGTYANRLIRPRYAGTEDPVPWAKS